MKSRQNGSLPWIILGLILVGGFGLLGLGAIALVMGESSGSRIALVELSGAITDEGAKGFIGGAQGGARDFIADVAKTRDDDSVKAVVIRINSPGGSASASEEMYQAVMRLREKKPVIGSMGDVAASGGYYVAAACDQIYANGSTLTGSIGVISQFLNYGELFRKLGLDQAVIKSGKFKDAGNPNRPLTPEERQLFQAMINDVYQQFVTDVVNGRKSATNGKLTRERLLKVADGRVLTGRQARQALLVDKNGGLYEAIQEAAKRGGIEGKPKVVNVSRRSGLAGLLGADSSSPVDGLGASLGAAMARGAVSQLKQEASAPAALPLN